MKKNEIKKENNIYYDEWEFKKILTLINIDPYSSKIKLEEYLEKYPKDYSAYNFYGYNLIMIGEPDKAEKVLNYVELNSSQDKQFLGNSKNVKVLKNNFLLNKLRLFCYKEKYDEVFKLLYFRKYKGDDDFHLSFLESYCKYKLGLLKIKDMSKISYLRRQLIDYSEEEFYSHVQKHLADSSESLNLEVTSIFNPGFPLLKVLDEVKKFIPSSKRLFPGLWEDVYIFKYNECGKIENKLTDYFKVVCFHNTDRIITMCPCLESDKLQYEDLNYLIDEDKTVKVKQISMVERFNKRYNIKK